MPASSSSRRSTNFRSRMGRDHRDQSVAAFLRHPRRDARHEEARLGPDHQHRLGAFAGRLAVQSAYVSAKHGIAGLTKSAALELATSRSPATVSARAMSGPRWSRTRSRDHEGAQLTKEQVIRDVLLARSPPRIRDLRGDRRSGAFLCGPDPAQITGAHPDRRRLDRGVGDKKEPHRALQPPPRNAGEGLEAEFS